MAARYSPSSTRKPARKRAGKPRARRIGKRVRPKKRFFARVRPLRRSPLALQVLLLLVVAGCLWFASNWIYQVIRKPSELFFPVSGVLFKTPTETWKSYAAIFRRDSTSLVPPELLAALAQTEGSGNPIARTYWRWSWRLQPFEVYRPASSSVGMYQMTDATFAEARNYCIRDHAVIDMAARNGAHGCWFNWAYVRVLPAHAVELTAAYLDRNVARALARNGLAAVSSQQKRHLAAVIHLCGAGAGELYARRGFRFAPGERCGDHDPRQYLSRVDSMERLFRRLDAGG